MNLINTALIYGIYRTTFVKLLRVLVLLGLSGLTALMIMDGIHPRLPLFFLNLFIMFEIYYRYGISLGYPTKKLGASGATEKDVASISVLFAYQSSGDAHEMVHKLLAFPHVQFLLERIPLTDKDLPKSMMAKDALLASAGIVAQKVGGTVITSMDVVAAYLLEEEPVAHVLRSRKLRLEDMLKVLAWARNENKDEESPRKLKISVPGGGIGESLLTGWTPETSKYTRVFTGSGHTFGMGREAEYQRMLEGLSKTENNNIVLVGEVGTGKENLVRKFVSDSFAKQVPHGLENKTVIELMAGELLAGTNEKGELEERLQSIIDEVSHAHNLILYIPEFENLLGSGSFALDLSGALMPYLKTGTLPVITTMSKGAYKTYLASTVLNQMFNEIIIEEPAIDLAEKILMEKADELEKENGIIITYLAVHQATVYADRYFANKEVLPGSGVDLLRDAISALPSHQPKLYYGNTKKLILTEDILITSIESKTKIAMHDPSSSEKDTLLRLEEILHKSVIGQNVAVTAIAEGMRRLRSGVEVQRKPISFLFLGPTGVGKTKVAKTLAEVYFGGEASMIRLDMSEYTTEDGVRRLLGSLPGEGEQRGELTEKVSDNPNSLILLDEFEKAHPAILNLFLQVLEDGRLTDNRGKTVSFINTIIIATSNAGSDFIYKAVQSGGGNTAEFPQQLMSYLAQNHLFRPELLNRFGSVITFSPLSHEDVERIAQLILAEVSNSLKEKDITVTFSESVAKKVATEAYNAEYGARPIRRYVQDTIEDILAQKLLKNEIGRGQILEMYVDTSNNLQVKSM